MGCTSSTAAATPGEQLRFEKVYEMGAKLGEGAFGEVRRADHRRTGTLVAVKVLDPVKRMRSPAAAAAASRTPGGAQRMLQCAGATVQNTRNHISSLVAPTKASRSADPQAKFVRAVASEVEMLKRLGEHPHCIQFLEVFRSDRKCFIVTELCKGTLQQFIGTPAMATVPELQRVFKEMALALAHVHEVQIVHRDVKPENFLVGGSDGKTIKLADFGAAALLQKGEALRAVYGTAPYMSPEMIGDEGYGQSTDVWSLGVTYYTALYGEYPYAPREPNPSKMKAAILFGRAPPSFTRTDSGRRCKVPEIPDGAKELVERCLCREPEDRLSAPRVARDPFLRDVPVHAKLTLSGAEVVAGTSWAGSDVSTALPKIRSAHSSEGGISSLQSGKQRLEEEQISAL